MNKNSKIKIQNRKVKTKQKKNRIIKDKIKEKANKNKKEKISKQIKKIIKNKKIKKIEKINRLNLNKKQQAFLNNKLKIHRMDMEMMDILLNKVTMNLFNR